MKTDMLVFLFVCLLRVGEACHQGDPVSFPLCVMFFSSDWDKFRDLYK